MNGTHTQQRGHNDRDTVLIFLKKGQGVIIDVKVSAQLSRQPQGLESKDSGLQLSQCSHVRDDDDN